MEPLVKMDTNTSPSVDGADAGILRSVVLELPLGDAVATFDLEKAVCSHGLFMMSPNHWDPLSKTLRRPLRLDSDDDSPAADTSSLFVQISHPSDTPASLTLRVFGTDYLSPHHQRSLLDQVKRMLRLSETEERNLRKFQQVYGEAKERGYGRVFRSPTLFEDMVKCILLCNCQWSRTLSMSRALCELQLELQCPLYNKSIAEFDKGSNLSGPMLETEDFAPITPQKELKVKNPNNYSKIDHFVPSTPAVKELKRKSKMSKGSASLLSLHNEEDYCKHCDSFQSSTTGYEVMNSRASCDLYSSNRIGNFPSPKELANLDEKFLAKRCNLGYRASRILSLAKSVVEGRIQLKQLEEASGELSLSNYDKLGDQLKGINGFGPFTCANVLMCMGFYHVIPTDSETIRHLKQVHAVRSTIKTVKEDAEVMYGKYAPFQFLVYWLEVWSFYEERFGKMSEMPHSDYKLITAANMRPKESRNKKKRAKRIL